MVEKVTVEGSVSLTEALKELASRLAVDGGLKVETRAAALGLLKCLSIMDDMDCLIAVHH